MTAAASSRAIVDLGAYAHNLGVIRRMVGERAALLPVIKADAYGHGLAAMARKAVDCGAAMLSVATVEEGAELRAAGLDGPILVMVQPSREALPEVLAHRLTLMVADLPTSERLGDLAHRAGVVAPVHCMIDTGMGRQGFALESAVQDLQYLTRISHVDIEGIATHFPVADQPEDAFTYNQIKSFKHLLKQIDRAGIPYEFAHAANSAGIVQYPTSHFTAVRPGLMTFGVWPTAAPPPVNPLQPVLRWETRVTQVRELEAGATVGYGRTYTVSSRMRAAILPVGYADGYKHRLSNRADVLIRGVRCPVRGSVCMDQIVVDVSQAPGVESGDIATLIGADGDERITAAELARHAETIPYDILTGIGRRVPREYV